MNRIAENADSQYVRQLKNLVDLVEPAEPDATCLVTYAKRFFTLTPPMKSHANDLAKQVRHAVEVGMEPTALEKLKKKYNDVIARLNKEQLDRQKLLKRIIDQVIQLCEGATFAETQLQSAKCLGSIVLLTQVKGGYQRYHQRLKPIYKAVLTLRLIDDVLSGGAVKQSYLSKFSQARDRFTDEEIWQAWYDGIAAPIISAAIIQDIGLHHPDAMEILYGEDGRRDPFRMLEEDDRKALLKTNYQATLTFIRDGVSFLSMADNDDVAATRTSEAHAFLLDLMQDTFTGKSGIGDIVKIPQVYASIVLSTKPGYSRLDLPKGYMIIEQMAKRGGVNAKLADHFIQIVGYFPQGFGICFIPVNEKGIEKDQYEYAIVSQLNPANPAVPGCRVVTRNLTFTTNGKEEKVPRDRNLFFNAAKQKLMKLDKARLAEIMSQMTKNFNESDLDNHIPSFWEPFDFFADKRHQNIWKKA